jgi:hypothetical protein
MSVETKRDDALRPSEKVNEAYERLPRGDVEYRLNLILDSAVTIPAILSTRD